MYSESENYDCQKNARSTVSATTYLPGAIFWLCATGLFNKKNHKNLLTICKTFQVTVWGDYGRIEGKKVFMGVAQIMLDDLNLSNIVIGWYKLFGTTSLVSGSTTLSLSRRSSITSFESLKLLN